MNYIEIEIWNFIFQKKTKPNLVEPFPFGDFNYSLVLAIYLKSSHNYTEYELDILAHFLAVALKTERNIMIESIKADDF